MIYQRSRWERVGKSRWSGKRRKKNRLRFLINLSILQDNVIKNVNLSLALVS